MINLVPVPDLWRVLALCFSLVHAFPWRFIVKDLEMTHLEILKDTSSMKVGSSISRPYIWVSGHINIEGHWHPYEMIYDDYHGQ